MYKVNLTVRVFNEGGMHPMIQQMNRQSIEHHRDTGQMPEEQAAEALAKLQDASRPMKEQFRFTKSIELPFAPSTDLVLDIEGFDFIVHNPKWNMQTQEFDCDMAMSVCSECDHDSCGLSPLRDHWDWVPPVETYDDEDDETETTTPSEPDSD